MAKAELEIRSYDQDPTEEPNAALGFLGRWKISHRGYDFVCNVGSMEDFMRFQEAIDYEPTPLFMPGPAVNIKKTAKKIQEAAEKTQIAKTLIGLGVYQLRTRRTSNV